MNYFKSNSMGSRIQDITSSDANWERSTTWENEKAGSMGFCPEDCNPAFAGKSNDPINVLYFIECTPDFNSYKYTEKEWKEKCPIIAKGFIVHYILHKNDKATDIYDGYYYSLRKMYADSESKKPGAHKRNLNDEFYLIHINEEKERIEQSQSLFDYLTTQDKETILSYVNDYFEYIKKECPQTADGKTDSVDIMKEIVIQDTNPIKSGVSTTQKPKRVIDEKKLEAYFKPVFKGAGNNNINYFRWLVEALNLNRTNKEFAQIALMCYDGGKMNNNKPNTFSEWYRIFCECVGCERKQYNNKKKLYSDTKEALKKQFNYLQ